MRQLGTRKKAQAHSVRVIETVQREEQKTMLAKDEARREGLRPLEEEETARGSIAGGSRETMERPPTDEAGQGEQGGGHSPPPKHPART